MNGIYTRLGVTDNNDIEVYNYALFVIVFNFFNVLFPVVLGFWYKCVLFALLYLLFFIPNRIFLGGYHCKKAINCFLLFGLINFLIIRFHYLKVNNLLVIFVWGSYVITLILNKKILINYKIKIALLLFYLKPSQNTPSSTGRG